MEKDDRFVPKQTKSGRSRYERHRSRSQKTFETGSRFWGNSTSVTGSRPTLPLERIFAKKEHVDIMNYKADDSRATNPHRATGQGVPRKTFAPFFESFETSNVENKQHHTAPLAQAKTPSRCHPRMIHLPLIHENLYLSNWDYAWNHVDDYSTVINMSEHPLRPKDRQKCQVIWCHLPDQEHLSFMRMEQTVMPLLDRMHDALQRGKVLIHCRAGVNRSPTVVVAYAMKKRKMSLQQIIRNIENRKREHHPHDMWDTLTNAHFLRFLTNWQ